jgi:cell division protein FtsN
MHLSGLRTASPIADSGDAQPQTAVQSPEPSEPASSANEDDGNAEAADQPQTRLEFYELLKQSEVPVPEASEPPLSEQEPTVEYILQAGSFRDSNDANRMRAELILLNLEARIETIGIADGDIWHRVMVGPYSSRSQMAKARSTLASKNIAPLVYKKAIAPQS